MGLYPICINCKIQKEIVYDNVTKEIMCSECGHLFEPHSLNDFMQGRINIDNGKGKATEMVSSSNVSEIPMSHIDKAFNRLKEIADKLGIINAIQIQSYELYKKVFYEDNPKSCRGRNMDALLGACMLVACQQEKLPRSVKEILLVIGESGATKKEVMKAKTFLTSELWKNHNSNSNSHSEIDAIEGPGLGRAIKASDFVERFCSILKIDDPRVITAALEAVGKCETEIDLRRSPISVAATVIYVVVQLVDNDEESTPTYILRDVAEATNVTEGTLRNTYKDIYPNVAKIVPSWYASEDTIRDLLAIPPNGVSGWIMN